MGGVLVMTYNYNQEENVSTVNSIMNFVFDKIFSTVLLLCVCYMSVLCTDVSSVLPPPFFFFNLSFNFLICIEFLNVLNRLAALSILEY